MLRTVCFMLMCTMVTRDVLATDVQDILNQYASARRTFDGVSAIFRYSTEQTILSGANTLSENAAMTLAEFRRDNRRFEYVATDITRGESAAQVGTVTHRMWNGQQQFQVYKFPQYEINDKNGYQVMLTQDKTIMRALSLSLVYSPLTGIFHGDVEPFDRIVSSPGGSIKALTTGTIGGRDCVVLEAVNSHGHYKVWMDPKRGCSIVRAVVTKGPGDIYFGKPLESYRFGPAKEDGNASDARSDGRTMNAAIAKLENVRLERQGDVWVPVSADHEKILRFSDGVTNRVKVRCSVDHLEVAPDFDLMNAFRINVPDGTRVYIKEAPGIRYEWRSGKPVPSIDQAYGDGPGF